MSVHEVKGANSAAAAGVQYAELRLDGVWFVHSVSLQNPDAVAAEPGMILVQFS